MCIYPAIKSGDIVSAAHKMSEVGLENDGDPVAPPAIVTAAERVMSNFLGVDCGVDSSAQGMAASAPVSGASCSTSTDLSNCKPIEQLTEADVQSLLQVQASTSGSGMGSELLLTTAKGNDTELSSTTSSSSAKHVPMKDVGKVKQAADSNCSQQSFVPCKVCGDRASGYHYGVTSCEGCKGFFRRSIQKQIEYRCLRDGTCQVLRLNRNRCQYCRFKKCLAVGMSRDSVRYGRVPKRSKSQEDQSVSSTDSSQDQSALESRQLAIYDVILSISQAHHAHCAVTDDKIKNIPRRPATLLNLSRLQMAEGRSVFTQEELENQKMLMWQQLATLVTPTIHSVVEFSKRVPSFSELSQDDQLILIKTGFFEIWLTRMARMFNRSDNTILFEDGSVIPREELDIVYNPDFVTRMFELSAGFSLLSLNDTEVGLFTGIILATDDRQALSDPQGVSRIQDRLIEALRLQVKRNHSTEENLFPSIIMKLPELRTLGTQHNEMLRWYRARWQQVQLPPLFAEIYDIPKSEEDAAQS